MFSKLVPFNLDLLILDKSYLSQLKKVSSLNTFIPSTTSFDPDGLFSTEIFGQVGSNERMVTFGYIDLHVKVLHPLIYKHLTKLKALYKRIMDGIIKAKFDTSINDFVEDEDGSTGYSYFLKYIDKLDLKDNGSDERAFIIKLIKKYKKDEVMLDKWLVLPAGLRDYVIDSKGKPSEDEVNTLYRKLLNIVNMVKNINIDQNDDSLLDPIRLRLQKTILEIYEHYKKLMDQKEGFMQAKWARRALLYGTRNVITGLPINITDIEQEDKITVNHTVCGLYQYIKGISPITKNKVITKFSNYIFSPTSNAALLVDPKTMKSTLVEIDYDIRDKWLTSEGLEDIMNKMIQDEIKKEPITLDGYYFMLIYDDGKNIELIYNTEMITDDMDKKYIRPITYGELFYLAIYDTRDKYVAYVTRYPVINLGSTYPSLIYLKTTAKGRTVKLKTGNKEHTIYEYPILEEPYYNSLSVHYTRLKGLGGDFDGDKVSFNILYTEESIKEVKDYLNSIKNIVSPDGKLIVTAATDPIDLTMKFLTE